MTALSPLHLSRYGMQDIHGVWPGWRRLPNWVYRSPQETTDAPRQDCRFQQGNRRSTRTLWSSPSLDLLHDSYFATQQCHLQVSQRSTDLMGRPFNLEQGEFTPSQRMAIDSALSAFESKIGIFSYRPFNRCLPSHGVSYSRRCEPVRARHCIPNCTAGHRALRNAEVKSLARPCHFHKPQQY